MMQRNSIIRITLLCLMLLVIGSCLWFYAAYRFRQYVIDRLSQLNPDHQLEFTIEGYPWSFALRANLDQDQRQQWYHWVNQWLEHSVKEPTAREHLGALSQLWLNDADVDLVLTSNLWFSNLDLNITSQERQLSVTGNVFSGSFSFEKIQYFNAHYSFHDEYLMVSINKGSDDEPLPNQPLPYQMNIDWHGLGLEVNAEGSLAYFSSNDVLQLTKLKLDGSVAKKEPLSRPAPRSESYFENPHEYTKEEYSNEAFLKDYNRSVRDDALQYIQYGLVNLLPLDISIELQSDDVGISLKDQSLLGGEVVISALSLATDDTMPSRVHWFINNEKPSKLMLHQDGFDLDISHQLHVNHAADRFVQYMLNGAVMHYISVPGTDALINPEMITQLNNAYDYNPYVKIIQDNEWHLKGCNYDLLAFNSLTGIVDNVAVNQGNDDFKKNLMTHNSMRVSINDYRYGESIGETQLFLTGTWKKRMAKILADLYFLSTPLLNNKTAIDDDQLLINKQEVYSMIDDLDDVQYQMKSGFSGYDFSTSELKNVNFDLNLLSFIMNIHSYVNLDAYSFAEPKQFDWHFDFTLPAPGTGSFFEGATTFLDYVFKIKDLRQRTPKIGVGLGYSADGIMIKREVLIDPKRKLSYGFTRQNSLLKSIVPLSILWSIQPI
ncbi:MAG: hypothetical protein ACON5A_05180 [Candidatus Comchoanobacterales bacterium]